MKSKIIIIVAVGLWITTACKKDASLSLSSENISFNESSNEKSLIISNDGEKDMEWKISSAPEWLNFSKTEGTIYGESEAVIKLTANVHFEQGNYNGTFLISSDGGEKNIIVDFNLNYTISVFPGIGIDTLKLNDTYGNIIAKLGTPDFYDSVHYAQNDLKLHIYGYDSNGFVLYIWNIYDDVVDEDIVEMFGVTSPYAGVTENNIGMGTPKDVVTQFFGAPENSSQSSYLYYYYDSKGIDFLIDQDLVGLIWIYNPVSSKRKLLNEYLARNKNLPILK